MKTDHLAAEAAAFDARIRERIAHGHTPDLRRVQPCDWFYNNQWRRPEYVDAIFGEYLRFALSHIPAKSRVLEVGSGPGHMALELARHGHDVTALELSRGCVAVARQLADENPFREAFGSLEYVAEDFFHWESDSHFDAICFFMVLHHFQDSCYADAMLMALRERFDETEFKAGHAILPRMIGGVRGTEGEALEMAAFLALFDRYCVDAGLLQPGAFYFAGTSMIGE